jgi:Carboxypeptidase regulatory-like domain/TonB dependent receptor-like, beta-barrel
MKLEQRLTALGVLLAILLFFAAPARAQFTSAIEGTVSDSSGGVVPSATVTLTNHETGVVQTAQTSGAGYYRFPSLGNGLYSVRVGLKGFKTVIQEQIRLQVAETKTVNLVMDVGQAEEEVTVQANQTVVETSQGRVSGLIEENQIENVPLAGRNFFQLVVLTPGVLGRATGGTQSYAQSSSDIYSNEYGVNMNANGARAESNNFLIDSSTVSSSQRSGVVNINPNTESVQEVRVSVNNFSAEYGRNGSVLVNIVTKSGTNDLHGAASYYYTNNDLQARNHFERTTPDFSRNEFTWGFGGPVVRDRTFFFVSGDVLRSGVAISRDVTVITPDFARFMQQNRPNNVSTYIVNTFPPSFTPDRNFRTAGQLLNSSCSGANPISSPIGSIPCSFPVLGVGTWNDTSPRNGLQWTARVDHTFNQGRDRLFGSINRTTTDKVGFGEPSVYPAFTAPSPTNSMHANVNYTKILGPTLLNEASFSWVRPWGELTNPFPEVPGITVGGLTGYQQGFGPNEFVQNSFEWRDVVTWTRGSHSMKIGGAYTREHADNDSSRTYNRPTYDFNNVFDFAADSPRQHAQVGMDPETGGGVTSLTRFHRTQSVSTFVQDDWKVKPNLSLNFGLRYEAFLNIYDASGDMANIVMGSGNDLRTKLQGAQVIERHYYLEGGLWDGGQHTFAPRVSFAWDPANDGRTSIRGGLGRSYDRMSNQIWDSEHLNLPGFAIASVLNSDPTARPVFGLGQNTSMPYNFPRPTGLSGGLNAQGGLVNGRGLVHVVDPDFDDMYLDNWFLGVQRRLGSWTAVEADYIGSRGRDAYRKFDINRFNGDMLDGRFDGILPGFAAINYTESTDQSTFNGGTIALKVNRSTLQFGAAYTFGKATDYSSSFSAAGRPDAYGPPDQDQGPADFDVRQKVALSANWMLPSPASGLARALGGGWQLAGVMIAQTGTPFSVVCNNRGFIAIRDAAGTIIGNSGCDFNADNFLGNDRPDVPAFGDSRSGLSNDDFLNGIFTAADFPIPTPGRPGALGRNTFRGPRYFNVDLMLGKVIRTPGVSSDGSLQLRLETFNLFNTLNLNNPDNNMINTTFGRSTSAQPGRIVQFSTRFSF